MIKKLFDHDVCIVGGGPTGLICAYMLANCGINTALVATSNRKSDGRTTAFLHHSVQILKTLGLWPELSNLGTPILKIRLIDDTRGIFRAPETIFSSHEIGLDSFGCNIPNDDMQHILDEIAKTLDFLTIYNTYADSIHTTVDDAKVFLNAGKCLTCSLIIGADGRESLIRKYAKIQTKNWNYNQCALVATLSHSELHHNVSTEFHTNSGPFTLVPLPGKKSGLVCVVTPETAKKLISLEPKSLAMEIEQMSKSLLGKIELSGECKIFPLSGLIADCVGRNRCVLVGEAAHVLPPIGAQGLNLGIRDVAWLGEALTKSSPQGKDFGISSIIADYNKVRKFDTWLTTTSADLLNRSLLTDFFPFQLIRALGVHTVNRIIPIRKFIMHQGLEPTRSIPKLARGEKLVAFEDQLNLDRTH